MHHPLWEQGYKGGKKIIFLFFSYSESLNSQKKGKVWSRVTKGVWEKKSFFFIISYTESLHSQKKAKKKIFYFFYFFWSGTNFGPVPWAQN